MYSYTYDKHTGGLLLNSTPTNFSKEPRPVYYRELDLLGFGKYCKYEKQDYAPYMWAEANCYYYRGRQVAKLKGGNLFTAPELIIQEKEDGRPELNGETLVPVDISAMVAKNDELLEITTQTTVKKIFGVYKKYKKKLDIFHVAFSGGKDSAVLLDLVKKALPKGSFVVVFGDTGMEFPDSYDVIDKVEKECKEEGITFRRAKSHLVPQKSWKLFGPPSRVLRWCCSVHKSTPQTLELRDLLKKDDYVGLDFVGVRAQESLNRSKYEYENYGKKQKGQFSHNSILEWTSAEIWLYIYTNDILINEAYKKGNTRAGCLFCPMSGGIVDYVRRQSYSAEIDSYVEIIQQTYAHDRKNKKTAETYVTEGGWNARKNGRELDNNSLRCIEKITNDQLTISVISPKSDWEEWIKTLGDIKVDGNNVNLIFERSLIVFSVVANEHGYVVYIAEKTLKENPSFSKMFRQVFRKAAYCNGCRVCEANCKNGFISFDNKGTVSIKQCLHCYECHSIDSGCLLFHSLRHPQGGGNSMKSLNSFADHAPKQEWLRSFFELKENFFTEHSLGPMMFDMFRRFLRDAGLIDKNHFTSFAEKILVLGWDTEIAWGIILANLAADNPQIQWYIKNLEIGRIYPRKTVEDMLTAVEVKEKDAKSIFKSFKRLVETPLGTKLNFGYVSVDGEVTRTPCIITDHRVVLYALYKFAEKCDGYWQFTLSRLLDHEVESDGVSPTEIFGLARADMEPILLGLTSKYPDFINATFTGDLDKISLRDDKTSADVLALF